MNEATHTTDPSDDVEIAAALLRGADALGEILYEADQLPVPQLTEDPELSALLDERDAATTDLMRSAEAEARHLAQELLDTAA